jgi:hypothetical protein
MPRTGELPEAPLLNDRSAPKDFDPLQKEVAKLLERRGPLGSLDARSKTTDGSLPSFALAPGDTVERFGPNAIISGEGGVKGVIHKGRKFNINPDGSVQGETAGSEIKGMHFDFETNKITFNNGKVRITFDPKADKTTIDVRPNKRTEITSAGVSYINDGKLTRFLASDRSFSIDVGADGVAQVKGQDGKALPPGHPMLALDGKKPEIDKDAQTFTLREGDNKTTTFYPGSHVVQQEGDKVTQVQYGSKTWTVTEDMGAKTKTVQDAGGTSYTAPSDKVAVAKDGTISMKLDDGRTVTINPKDGSEKITEANDKQATIKYAELPGRRPYEVKMAKDDKGWGVTEVKDERGAWTFSYKGAPGAAGELEKVSGPGGTFEKGKNCSKLSVGENGEITVNFKPGEKYQSATFKPGSNEEVYRVQDGRNLSVKYEVTAGKARVVEVSDGSDTFKLSPDGKKLTEKDGTTLFEVGKNAKEIAFDPVSKGFKITTADSTVEVDPTRRSVRVTKAEGGKDVTTETFHDKHKVVSEKAADGSPAVRSFTTPEGKQFKVVYKNQDKPDPKEVVTVLGQDSKPIPEIARYHANKINVTPEGVVQLYDAKGREVDKYPTGKLLYTSQAGTKIETGREVPRGNVLQGLTFKGTGETLTYDPATDGYTYRNPAEPDKPPKAYAGKVGVDYDGNLFVNGKNLGRDPNSKDFLAAMDAKPADVRPRVEGDGVPDDPGGRVARNKDRFVLAERLPNGVRYKDGTTVTTDRSPLGSVTTTTDGQTGLQIKYTKDLRGQLTRIDNPDGSVWRKVGMAGGYEKWTDNSVPPRTAQARTSGPGQGLDQFGFFHFTLAMRAPNGRTQPVNLVCSPEFQNMYDQQFAFFQRNGYIMPQAPPWMMPARPKFDRLPLPRGRV